MIDTATLERRVADLMRRQAKCKIDSAAERKYERQLDQLRRSSQEAALIIDEYALAVRGEIMKASSGQQFEVQSYIGSEIAEMGYGERPPRSAKFVIELDMGSGPGGGDYRTYLLSSNKRSGWTLWQMGHDYDTGKPSYCRVAYGWPYRGYPAKHAAEQLLTRVWEDERDQEGFPSSVVVQKAGLLTAEDIERIELTVFADDED